MSHDKAHIHQCWQSVTYYKVTDGGSRIWQVGWAFEWLLLSMGTNYFS